MSNGLRTPVRVMSDDLVGRYRELQEAIGGCHDGYCVIRKPKGQHTNGGCTCLEDLRLHERSRIGHLLRSAQDMAARIEELEAKLAEAVSFAEGVVRYAGTNGNYCLADEARAILAELKGGGA